MGCPREGGTLLFPWGEGGRAGPWSQRYCYGAGNSVRVAGGDRPSFLGWQNHPGSKAGSPHGSHGAGGCAGVRSSGADGGKGTEEGIKVLK